MTEDQDVQAADAVITLTGAEGGRWRVTTQSSHYIFDLDEGTVTRFRGPGSGVTVNDRCRPILEIVHCTVGASGYWTMGSDGGPLDLIEHYWQVCTVISSIEPLSDDV